MTDLSPIVSRLDTIISKLDSIFDKIVASVTGNQSVIDNDNKNKDEIISNQDQNTDKVNQNIDDNMDSIKNDYDNSSMDSENDRLDSKLDEYNKVEDELLGDVNKNISNFYYENPLATMTAPLSHISLLLTGIYNGLGEFNIPIGFSLTLTIALLCIGWYRFKGG